MTTLEIRPTPDCGNPAHYDEESYCPHCGIPMCADENNCPAPNRCPRRTKLRARKRLTRANDHSQAGGQNLVPPACHGEPALPGRADRRRSQDRARLGDPITSQVHQPTPPG